jgi:hypothetical protein
MVIAVMFAGYSLNSQLNKIACSIEMTTENNNNNAGDLQSDSDVHEDENSNHISQLICITENLSTSFTIQNPSLLKFHSYSVWQPPKNC